MNNVFAHPATHDPEEVDGPESYIISTEYKAEIVYQELLPKLLELDEHINN